MKKEQLHEAMVNFQYLEFMLRGAIEKFEQIIRDEVKEYFEYPYDQNAIDRMALGALAEQYSKYASDKKFKTQVGLVIQARNKLAHAMFVKAEHLSEKLGVELEIEINEIHKTSEVAAALGDIVVEHMQHIYFDPHEQKWIKA
jgi:hypothetical protein